MRAAIRIHSLADARAAVQAAHERGVRLVLVSAPDAGGYAGAAWFDQVVRQAAADHPDVAVTAVLDCGDAPGHVLAALRQGVKAVRFTGDPSLAERLADIASAYAATVTTAPVEALDLRGTRDALAACRDWLARHDG